VEAGWEDRQPDSQGLQCLSVALKHPALPVSLMFCHVMSAGFLLVYGVALLGASWMRFHSLPLNIAPLLHNHLSASHLGRRRPEWSSQGRKWRPLMGRSESAPLTPTAAPSHAAAHTSAPPSPFLRALVPVI
jgi:hypothetical protein